MLGNLIKPGWQHPDKTKRLKAIKALDSTKKDDRLALSSLIQQDPEIEVQLSAISQLRDAEALLELLQGADESISTPLTHQIKKVVADLSLVDLQTWLNSVKQKELAQQLALQSYPDNNIRTQLVERLDENQLVEIVGEIEFSETRSAIAQKIDTETLLETARKNLKGKDKQAERIVRDKLDAIRTERKIQSESDQTASEILEQLEFLANHDEWRSEFEAKYRAALNKFQQLPRNVPEPLRNKFEALCKIIESRVQQQGQIDEAQKTRNKIITDLENLYAEMAELDVKQLCLQASRLNSKLDSLEQSWHKCVASFSAPSADTQRYAKADEINHQFRQLAQELVELIPSDESDSSSQLSSNDLPKIDALLKSFSKLESRALLELKELKTNVQATFDKQQQAYEKALKHLHQRISRLSATTKAGNLKVARKELSATQKASEGFEGKDLLELSDRLKQAEEAVTKLADWHSFATTPKFQKLCEDMELLRVSAKDNKLHPDNLAQKINGLHKKWKELGYCADETLWDQFKAAADQAYKPCAEFFAERNKQRLENLKKREPFIQALKEMLQQENWQSDDEFRQAEKQLIGIHNDWLKVKNVDRAKGKKQWDEYRKLRTKVLKRLDVAYDKNIQLKQTLTEQAEKLSLGEMSEASLSTLKNLQARWKEIGITRRKQDQDLWKLFKKNCDAAYDNLQTHRQQKRDDLDAMLTEHRRLIDAIYTLSKANQAADASFDALASEFESLPMLPKDFPEKKWAHTKSQFSKAKQAYARAKERQEKQAASKQDKQIAQKALLCAELERLHTLTDKNEADISDIEAQIEGIQLSDKATERLFQQRLEQATISDRSKFDKIRRLLCVRMEISTNTDTPKADRALRTELQLERMSQKGLAGAQQGRSIKELKLEWMTSPGASPELEAELQLRVDAL